MGHRMLGASLSAIALIALIGCSSSGGSAAPASEGAASAAAATQAASEAAPTVAAASEATPSEAAASNAIPGFSFPSTDKELEALLPSELCGKKVQKLSIGGDALAGNADPTFAAILAKLGKSTSDVSFAIATPTTADGKCTAGIFRIKGADSGALKDAFLAEAAKESKKYEVRSIGGKDVYVDPTDTSFGYAYIKDDGIVIVGADNEADAATIIAAMP